MPFILKSGCLTALEPSVPAQGTLYLYLYLYSPIRQIYCNTKKLLGENVLQNSYAYLQPCYVGVLCT